MAYHCHTLPHTVAQPLPGQPLTKCLQIRCPVSFPWPVRFYRFVTFVNMSLVATFYCVCVVAKARGARVLLALWALVTWLNVNFTVTDRVSGG